MIFLENAVKIRNRADADRGGDFKNAVLRFGEHALRLADTNEIEIFGEGCARCLLKDAAEITGIEAKVVADLIKAQHLGVMLVDVVEGGENLLHLLALIKLDAVGKIAEAIEEAEGAVNAALGEHFIRLFLLARLVNDVVDAGDEDY